MNLFLLAVASLTVLCFPTPAQAYIDLGYQIAIYPGTGFLAAAHALHSIYGTLKRTGATLDLDVPLREFMTMARDMGFQEVWDFDAAHKREAAE